ncbi:MAG: hypothetical protein H7Y42_05220 [Chitinophagaceae bacterium]|nr:hypothetical protein [Chitinophagaceae bacterium]
MNTIMVIFNGIRFSYELVDRVIKTAKETKAGIHALFIKAEDEVAEGYGFPSDLDAAENITNSEDTEAGNVRVIRSQMKLLEDMAKTDKIQVTTELITEPSIDDIMSKAKDVDKIFVDDHLKDAGILSFRKFDLEMLMKKSTVPIEVVKASD